MNTEKRISFRTTVTSSETPEACAFLSQKTGLSKTRVKDAMNKGAVWLRRKGRGRERLRRATAGLKPGDVIELFYDADMLSIVPPRASCLMEKQFYSIWHKPAGLLSQGTDWSDHCSLLRQAETAFAPHRGAFPVHRLDREVEGLVIVAHTREAASKLSLLFQQGKVSKTYRAEVLGRIDQESGIIEEPLDGKPARTRYSVMTYEEVANTSMLSVEIETGRLHQIRRHLDGIGHPVMGDPRYGRGNKDGRPMRLMANSIAFRCPFTGERIECRIDTCT